jgi:hypothetical protein
LRGGGGQTGRVPNSSVIDTSKKANRVQEDPRGRDSTTANKSVPDVGLRKSWDNHDALSMMPADRDYPSGRDSRPQVDPRLGFATPRLALGARAGQSARGP